MIAGNKTYFDSFEVQHIPRKLENLLEIKILQRIFIEYKHMIQKCVDIFVLDILISSKQVKVY